MLYFVDFFPSPCTAVISGNKSDVTCRLLFLGMFGKCLKLHQPLCFVKVPKAWFVTYLSSRILEAKDNGLMHNIFHSFFLFALVFGFFCFFPGLGLWISEFILSVVCHLCAKLLLKIVVIQIIVYQLSPPVVI